jgi:hypothetical protein
MKVKFRMTSGGVIRDGSGRYACPNLYCWRELSTGHQIDTPECPNCGIELDWHWVNFDKQYPPVRSKHD